MTEKELLELKIEEPSQKIYKEAKKRFDRIAKPVDGFGRFEDIICSIAAMREKVLPDISNKALIIMCADNGVTEEGVSQTGRGVTASVAKLMGAGKSSVGLMTRGYNLKVIPVDVGIDTGDKIEGVTAAKISRGTGNIAKTAAMTKDQCLLAIGTGIETVKKCHADGACIIATGEMGIGNTTTATALFCALTGRVVSSVVGRGAGLSDEGLKKKTEVIEDALLLHGLAAKTPVGADALSALAKVGGLDIAALCGVFIGAAMMRVPAVIDGAISAVAALTAEYIVRGCSDYMIASHKGRERITEAVHDILGLSGVIDADMALGEGTGAVMLFPLLDMVMSVYRDGTFFEDTDIRQYERFDR